MVACGPDRIHLTLDGTDAGAGNIDYTIAFTNRKTGTCTIGGVPNVAVYGADGSQVGAAATPTQGGGPTFRLPSGESAYAVVRAVNIGTDGGPLAGRCTPVVGGGGGFVDLISADTALQRVPAKVSSCEEHDLEVMTLTPLKPAA